LHAGVITLTAGIAPRDGDGDAGGLQLDYLEEA
jgi:hypothetical protein